MSIQISNEDNLQFMARYPDKFFDFAIVDPPYGIGEDGGDKNRRRKGGKPVIHFEKKSWDKNIHDKAYFDELKRVSKNVAIFGANYMVEHLSPSMGWIVWDKGISGDFSDCELIYTSFRRALRKIFIHYKDDYNGKWYLKIHPTQKPIRLYKWILQNYAEPGWKILDTGTGSGSLAIACLDMGFDLYGCEKDKGYYEASMARIKEYQAQQELFPISDIMTKNKNTLFDQEDIG
jgi:site-specific DNA-methyltransferase (adenine-specific)